MLLSIAIPTYNRPLEVVERINELIPQLTSDVEFLILDNNSVPEVEKCVLLARPELRDKIRFYRHDCNIGLVGNILRGLEYAEGDYTWILGDDDRVCDSAVTNILRTISEHPENVIYSFKSLWSSAREKTVAGTGISCYLHEIDTFHSQLFISSLVFHRKSIAPFMRYGYHFTYSMGGFLAPVLIALKNGGSFTFSHLTLVEWGGECADRWHPLPVYTGIMTLLELPLELPKQDYAKLAGLLVTHVPAESALLRVLLKGEILLPPSQARYLFRQINSRSKDARRLPFRNPRQIFETILFRILLLLPTPALGIFRKLVGERYNSVNLADVANRL